MEPIRFHYTSQNNMSHTAKLLLDNFCNPGLFSWKREMEIKEMRTPWQLSYVFLFFFVPPTVQQTSWGLSHISKPLTLKFKVQLVGVLQHTRGAGGGGGAKCSSVIFLQQVARLKVSTQHAPNWSVSLIHNAKFDAADCRVPFSGFLWWFYSQGAQETFYDLKGFINFLIANEH